MNVFWLVAGIAAIVILFIMFIMIVNRYKRCPSDKVLVVFGSVGKDKTAKCIHGGAAFIWPIIQDFSFLDLAPISIDVKLQNALSKQQIRIGIPSTFTIGISTDPAIMPHAAERLLGLEKAAIKTLAEELITGQLRQIVATMTIEQINTDRETFLGSVAQNVETELHKVGLKLINVNITDIKDESGYIEALGKNASAEAVNNAKIQVAEKTRDGEIGQANAQREQRVKVSEANAVAVEGENKAKVTIAESNSALRQKQAEAERSATAAEKVAEAKAQQESYKAQQEAELAKADRERAAQTADEVVKAEIAKTKIEIAAEAEAEKTRREAKGQADAIFAKMEAQAKGMKEILDKQAEGFKNLVAAAGNDPQKAAMLLIVDKLPEIIKIQVEAVKAIKIDKITVWDSGSKDGNGSTANFISGMMKSVPPLQNLFQMAGMELPEWLGEKKVENVNEKVIVEDKSVKK